MIQNSQNGITYYTFENLRKAQGVHHLFTTRLGGVSTGIYDSMNLSGILGDDQAAVEKNYQRIASLDFPIDDMVCAQQTHSCNVRLVTATDRGNRSVRKRGFTDIDGLVTNDPSVTLVTHYADCVPLYFYDPVMRAIGLSHAGWRGTVGQIGVNTVQAMIENFDSNPRDILVGIGPSICKDCFEVGNEVAAEFVHTLPWATNFITPCAEKPDKSYIDLQGINRQSLINVSVAADNIELPGICTKENSDIFYSHRVAGRARGSLAAFLRLT